MEIFLASGNRHKQKELQEILSEHKILIPSDVGIEFSPVENGKTFFENSFMEISRIKVFCGKDGPEYRYC